MAKTRTWIYIIVAILLLSLAASLFLWQRKAPGRIANVYADGELVRSVDLDALASPLRFTVETERGENVILAEPGRIRVESADCPDQICVESGWLSDSAAPIVCLPHRVIIELAGETALDGEAG